MYNRENKNWNNFALGLLVMILPLLAIPERLADILLVASGFFIVLFSLARVSSRRYEEKVPPPTL